MQVGGICDDVARSLASDTAGDEVDAWHATIAIDRALRHSHRTRHAARAAWEINVVANSENEARRIVMETAVSDYLADAGRFALIEPTRLPSLFNLTYVGFDFPAFAFFRFAI